MHRLTVWDLGRLKQLLRDRLEECGWRDDVYAQARGEFAFFPESAALLVT
jgi:hypothetical protein